MVLPAPPWPTRATLRILAVGNVFTGNPRRDAGARKAESRTVPRDSPGRLVALERSRGEPAGTLARSADRPWRSSSARRCSTDAGAPRRRAGPRTRRRPPAPPRHHRRRAHGLRARRSRSPPRCSSRSGHLVLGRRRRHRRRRQRPARRRDRPRQRPGRARGARSSTPSPTASPTRLLLGGVAWYLAGESPVPRRCSRSRCVALLDAHLVRAGPGRGARDQRARRAHGAGRAVRVPRHRPRVRHPRAGAVGHARAHRVHRGAIGS